MTTQDIKKQLKVTDSLTNVKKCRVVLLCTWGVFTPLLSIAH